MAVFNFTPSWSTQIQVEPKVHVAQFGDGYQQSAPNGLNNVLEKWSLVFKDIKDADYFSIKAFLKTHKGSVAFQWTTPDGQLLWFVCRSWSGSPTSFNVRDFNMTFEQVMV